MKKIIALLLVFSTVCLTACNKESIDTTAATGKTEQTESTNITTQTTEANQQTNTNQTEDTNQTAETTRQTNTNQTTETTGKTEIPENPNLNIPEGYENRLVVGQSSHFFDLPSRIVFSQERAKDVLRGDRYVLPQGRGELLSYYSKADGEFYFNCYDPLCDHTTCPLHYVMRPGQMAYYNNRFYCFDDHSGTIESLSFDGSDRRIECQILEEPITNGYIPFQPPVAYGNYWYIRYLHEDGTYHALRFDMKTGELVDLTEQTGNYVPPLYFYNGKMYGRRNGIMLCADLDLKEVEECDIRFRDNFKYTHSVGSVLIGYILEYDLHGDGVLDDEYFYPGVYTYDFATGEETFISSEDIGKNVAYILHADENYIYFTSDELGEYLGQSTSGSARYSGSPIYRVNRDGTNCICVFKDPTRYIYPRFSMLIYEDKVFIYAAERGVVGTSVQTWNEGRYIGTIQADGTIDKLEYILVE